MHEINLTTQMDIFYHAINYASKGIIDTSNCGAFKIRNAEEARQLIEDLYKCNQNAPSEGKWSYWTRYNDSHRSKARCSYEQTGEQ